MKLLRTYANHAATLGGDAWGITFYRRYRSTRFGWEWSPARTGARWLHVWWGSPTEHRWWALSTYINLGGRA